MERSEQTPFPELPEALVEEMLSKSELTGDKLYDSFKEIHHNKSKLRGQLQNLNMQNLYVKDCFVAPLLAKTELAPSVIAIPRLREKQSLSSYSMNSLINQNLSKF